MTKVYKKEVEIENEDDNRALDYKDRLLTVIEKSQETFEKQLSFISSGAIIGSLLIIEKFYEKPWETSFKSILIVGLVALIASLLVNLLSHVTASEGYAEVVSEIEKKKSKYDYSKADKCRSKIRSMNSWSVWLLIGGILFIVIYISINTFIMAKDSNPSKINEKSTEKFGIAGPIPSKPKVDPKPLIDTTKATDSTKKNDKR